MSGPIEDLTAACIVAVMAGQDRMTLSEVKGKPPKGFPRGELLSVGTNGARNRSVDPLKVLAWLREQRKKS